MRVSIRLVRGMVEVKELAGISVETRCNGSAVGNQEFVTDRHQIALRCHAGKGRTVVRLIDVHRAAAVVYP